MVSFNLIFTNTFLSKKCQFRALEDNRSDQRRKGTHVESKFRFLFLPH